MAWKEIIFYLTVFMIILQVVSVRESVLHRRQLPKKQFLRLYFDKNTTIGHSNVYNASVTLELEELEYSKTIEVHASYDFINITDVHVNKEKLEKGAYNRKFYNDILEINRECNVNCTVRIDFTGIINDIPIGIYRSPYYEKDEKRYWIGTQLQPTYARRAFPCYDEPDIKYKFQLIIDHSYFVHALSNTESYSGYFSHRSDYKTTTFMITKDMPIYQLSFIMMDNSTFMENLINPMKTDTIQVYNRRSIKQGELFIQEEIPRTVVEVETYTDMHINELKNIVLNIVAVPNLPMQIMDNSGVPFFREDMILYQPGEMTSTEKFQVISNMCHEISNLWVSNQYIPNYLRKGLATFIEAEITNKLFREYEMEYNFLVNYKQLALQDDSKNIIDPVGPFVIYNNFDKLNYRKVASILRMFSNYMSHTTFQQGLKQFLRKINRNNDNYKKDITMTDLITFWDEIREEEPSLKKIMMEWIEKPGYPLISVELLENRKVGISQQRFTYKPTNDPTKWFVPITANRHFPAEKVYPTTLYPANNITIELKGSKYILLNDRSLGFYRVNYDKELWKRISDSLKERVDNVDVLSRAQIIDDLFNLARAGYMNYTEAMPILQFLKNDTSIYSWIPAFNGFNFLLNRVGRFSTLGETIKEEIRELMEEAYKSSGTIKPYNSDMQNIKFELMHNWGCFVGNKDCVANATEKFQSFKAKNIRIDPHEREYVFCTYLREYGVEDDWQVLFHRYEISNTENYCLVLIKSLGCITDDGVLKRFMEKVIEDNSTIRLAHRNLVFYSVADGSSVGIQTVLTFINENIKQLLILNENMFIDLYPILRYLAERINFSTFHQFQRLRQSMKSEAKFLPFRLNTPLLEEIDAIVENNNKWAEHNIGELKLCFNSVSYNKLSFILILILLVPLFF